MSLEYLLIMGAILLFILLILKMGEYMDPPEE